MFVRVQFDRLKCFNWLELDNFLKMYKKLTADAITIEEDALWEGSVLNLKGSQRLRYVTADVAWDFLTIFMRTDAAVEVHILF